MAAISCVPTTLVAIILCSCLISSIDCWDNDDLELFDLVEEVNQNFYELYGIDQSATTAEVRKAYRRLSLRHHPDKSDAENAEEKFRQTVAIYEVLKDATKREKYDRVLVDGLPDWKQPVYYYRRARKMGMWELAIVLFIISIIGQYCVGWAMYIERRLALEDMLSSKKKKKGKKGKSDDAAAPEEELVIPTPRVLGLWPFTLTVWTVKTVYNLPSTIREWKEEKELIKEEEERERILEEKQRQQQKLLQEELARKPRKKGPVELPEYSPEMYANFTPPVGGQKSVPGHSSGFAEELERAAMVQERFGEEWTDAELILLSKAVRKYPAGVPERWEKIADLVGRSVVEVTNKSKEVRGGLGYKPNTNMQGISNTRSNLKISDEIITQSSIPEEDEDEMDYDNIKVRKRKNKAKNGINHDETAVDKNNLKTKDSPASDSVGSDKDKESTKIASDGWTQNQQTIFEWALKQYPKGTDRRWDLVAEHIPGKSKEDCIARFKELAELISKKKKQDLVSKSKSS